MTFLSKREQDTLAQTFVLEKKNPLAPMLCAL